MTTTQPEKSDIFYAFFEQFADPILILENGVFIDFNKAAEQALQVTDKANFLPIPPALISPERQPDGQLSSEKSEEMIGIALQKGSHRFEWAHRRMNGEDFIVELTLTAVQLEDRKIIYALWRDVSERKQAEANVKYLASLVETANEAILSATIQGEITSWNQAAEKLLGYSKEEMLGKQILVLSPPEIREQSTSFIEKLSRGENVTLTDTLRLTKSGRKINVTISASAIKNDDGQVTHFSTVMNDISERKLAEEELRRFQLMVQNSSEFISMADLNGNMIFLNAAGQKMVGVEEKDISSLVIFNIIPEDYQPVVQEQTLPALMEKGEWSGELRYRNVKTGNIIEVYASTYMLRDPMTHEAQYLVNISRDMTEQKQREALLQRQSNALAQLAKSEVIYSGNLQAAIQEITKVTAITLGIQRASIWLYDTSQKTIECHDLYEEGNGHSSGIILSEEDYPAYFKALRQERVIAANNAHTDPQTSEFSQHYLTPLNIQSMLDAPIHLSGKMIGVLCNEHVGGIHSWSLEEQSFASSIADFITSAFLAHERRTLEEENKMAFERRGYQVQVSTEISQEIAAATELNELFKRVVTLTKERLGYYHTQLLRYDSAQDAVALINGYGEIGARMQADGHKLPMGKGLIGTAAASGETVMRPTLAEDLDWQPNPLLPETKGEIAVPIKLGNQILGVLDAQSSQAGDLTEDDRLLLEGLCGQIAVAIEQTRLRQEMADRLEEVNRLYRTMSHESWNTYRETTDLPAGFMFDQTGTRAIETEALPDELFSNIPMKVLGGEVVGTLTVSNDPNKPTSTEDLAFLEQVSDQIALALESARLFEQTQSTLAETESLYQLSATMNTAATFEDILQVLRENTILGKNSQNISLNIFDQPWTAQAEPQWINVLARWSLMPTSAVMDRYPLELFPSARSLLKADSPTLIEDLETDPRVDANARDLYVKRFGAKSTLFIPLVVAGQWIGYVNAIYQQHTTFPETDIRRLTALAAQATVVINNLRQVERIQQQAERESALNVISQKIQSATTVEAVLQIAARELGHALGAPMTIAQLSMKDKK